MKTHVMVDLETMGSGYDAAITQIGAVKFDPATGILDPKEFSVDVKLESSVAAGLQIDAATVSWWMGQSAEARAHLTEAGQREATWLYTALGQFERWLGDPKEIDGIWSHGATFDLPILRNAYCVVNKSLPWSFRVARDTRTLFWLVGDFNPWPADLPGEVKHRAIDDARRQARAVSAAINHLASQIVHGR